MTSLRHPSQDITGFFEPGKPVKSWPEIYSPSPHIQPYVLDSVEKTE